MTKASKKRGDRRSGEPTEQALSAVRAWELGGKVGEKPPRKRTGPQCAAHTTSGEPCYNPPMKFSTTCRKHGAAAPQVKKKARERLLELVDPALASLDKVLRDEKTDDNAKIKAAIAVLDRTGFRPGVVVQVSTGDEWGSIFSDALTDTDDRALPGAPTVLELDRGTADYDQGRRDQEDRDDEDHGSTRLDHENYDVVLVPRRSSGPGPFADPNRPPADPRSQHDPSEAATARAFEARLRDRIEGR